MKITQPLKVHGGKRYLASKIVSLFPQHRHYVEPFAGGAAVLLERDPNDPKLWWPGEKGVSEVLNDISGELMCFWTVLQTDFTFKFFERYLQATPLSRAEYNNAIVKPDGDDDYAAYGGLSVVRALKFFVAARQSLAGRFKGFTSLTRSRLRRGINGNASEWLGAIDGLPQVHARLRPVVLECMDGINLIEREDTPETLFYCDPPYLDETRTAKSVYEHEMSREDHERLLKVLTRARGKVMLSGYRSGLYDKALQGWRRVDYSLPNNAAGGKTKRRMTESLWLNYG